MQRGVEVGRALLDETARVLQGLVVDHRRQVRQHMVEQQHRLQLGEHLIQVLRRKLAEGLQGLFALIVG